MTWVRPRQKGGLAPAASVCITRFYLCRLVLYHHIRIISYVVALSSGRYLFLFTVVPMTHMVVEKAADELMFDCTQTRTWHAWEK